jgi:hypothetical protein
MMICNDKKTDEGMKLLCQTLFWLFVLSVGGTLLWLCF